MSVSVDTPQPATVALTGEISFFACIAQQDQKTQAVIWDALFQSHWKFSKTRSTEDAIQMFHSHLADEGITVRSSASNDIAPSCFAELSPAAREALRDHVDARDIVEQYARSNDAWRSNLMEHLAYENGAAKFPEQEDSFQAVRWFRCMAFDDLTGDLTPEDWRSLGLTEESAAEIRALTLRIEQIASNAESLREEWYAEAREKYARDHRHAAELAAIFRQVEPNDLPALMDGMKAFADVLRAKGTDEEAARAFTVAHNAHSEVEQLTAGHVAEMLAEVRTKREAGVPNA